MQLSILLVLPAWAFAMLKHGARVCAGFGLWAALPCLHEFGCQLSALLWRYEDPQAMAQITCKSVMCSQ